MCPKISYEDIIQDSETKKYCQLVRSDHQVIQTRPTRIGGKCGVKYRILLFIELIRLWYYDVLFPDVVNIELNKYLMRQ